MVDDDKLRTILKIQFTQKKHDGESIFHTFLLATHIESVTKRQTSEKVTSHLPFDSVHPKRDCGDGSKIDGIRQPIICCISLDEPGHKIFGNLELKNEKAQEKVIGVTKYFSYEMNIANQLV